MYIYASAKNCIDRLRNLGCDIDDATKLRMLDEARVHHLLDVQMKRTVEECREYYCEQGHGFLSVFKRPRRKVAKSKTVSECPTCGGCWTAGYRVLWRRRKDGTLQDGRRQIEILDKFADPSVYRAL